MPVDEVQKLEDSLREQYGCRYSTTTRDRKDDRLIHIYVVPDEDQSLEAITDFARGLGSDFTFEAHNAVSGFVDSEKLQDSVGKRMAEVRLYGEVWTEPTGLVRFAAYDDGRTSKDTGVILETFSAEIDAGKLEGVEPIAVRKLAGSVWDYSPERGGQVRVVDMPPGVPDEVCSTGAPMYNFTYYHFMGTIAGHCGPEGYGVWAGGMAAYLDSILLSCGWSTGTCYTDIAYYWRWPLDGNVLDGSTYRGVEQVGDQYGASVDTFVCKTGYTTGTTCGRVTVRSKTLIYGVTGGPLSVTKAFDTNLVCTGGDSGGVVYSNLGSGKVKVWGSVSGAGENSCGMSKIYWTLSSTNSIIVNG
ncbi:MAG: hypothetical protein AB7Q27_15050 [Acidimicrobiia bacterium]